jgi:hypothetical protein
MFPGFMRYLFDSLFDEEIIDCHEQGCRFTASSTLSCYFVGSGGVAGFCTKAFVPGVSVRTLSNARSGR